MSKQVRLGFMWHGVGTGQDQNNIWRDPAVPIDASTNVRVAIEVTRRLEAAGFDFAFIADTPFVAPDSPPHYLDRLEPLTLLSALAVSTEHIGLVGTFSTSYNSPYNLARRLQSLDVISGGRAGWNVVATGDAGTAKNFGREEHYGYDVRYPRAREHVEVVRGLWDSYEDDAFPHDRTSGTFHHPEKQHALRHHGDHFRVEGPVALHRSPQGHPVLFQAGDSDEGRDLGGAIAEGIFTHSDSLEAAQRFLEDITSRAVAAGRTAEDVLVLPGVPFLIEDTDAEAQARQSAINRSRDFDRELAQFGRPFGWHDFRRYDLDAPFPIEQVEPLAATGHRSGAERIIEVARTHGYTLRQTVWHFADRRNPFAGSPVGVADEIQRWVDGRGSDGFIAQINPWSADFDRFTNEVLPILRERGLFREDYEGTTLRENLGLGVPANRWAAGRADAGDEADLVGAPSR